MDDVKARVEVSFLRARLGLSDLPNDGAQVGWTLPGQLAAESIDAYLEGIGDGVFVFTLTGIGGVQGRIGTDGKDIEVDSCDADFLELFLSSVSHMKVVEGGHDG